jgi:hypothetical protein
MDETGPLQQAKSPFGTSNSDMADSGTSKARITVQLQPRASRDKVLGWNEQDVLRVRVKAAPVEGAANAALVQLLAKSLGVPKRNVTLVSGTTSRIKIVEVEGLTDGEIRSLLRR